MLKTFLQTFTDHSAYLSFVLAVVKAKLLLSLELLTRKKIKLAIAATYILFLFKTL